MMTRNDYADIDVDIMDLEALAYVQNPAQNCNVVVQMNLHLTIWELNES